MISKQRLLQALTGFWYDIVSCDHHKDRDCHFDITQQWSYGDVPKWIVSHYGYVGSEINEEFESYEEAENFLIFELQLRIEKYTDIDSEYLKEEPEVAKRLIEIRKDYDTYMKGIYVK